MAKKTPKTSKKTPTRKTPRKPLRARHETWKNVFGPAILQLVIRPALSQAADIPLSSIGDFYHRFQERHQCSVSLAQFRGWLRDLNILPLFQGPRQVNPFGVTQTVPSQPTLNPMFPGGLPTPTASPMGGDSSMGGDDILFDNEKAGFVPPELRGPGAMEGATSRGIPPELEAALSGSPAPDGGPVRPRTIIPGFDLSVSDPNAGALNLPGITGPIQ